jgi:hypothetical protein
MNQEFVCTSLRPNPRVVFFIRSILKFLTIFTWFSDETGSSYQNIFIFFYFLTQLISRTASFLSAIYPLLASLCLGSVGSNQSGWIQANSNANQFGVQISESIKVGLLKWTFNPIDCDM